MHDEWIDKKIIITALQGVKRQDRSWTIDASQSALKEIKEKNNSIIKNRVDSTELNKIDSSYQASLTNRVVIDRLEVDIIKRQKLSKYCEKILLEQLGKNIKAGKKLLAFYTDGSLAKEKLDEVITCKQGLGWLQVDENENFKVQDGSLSIQQWPSSTCAELAAIWVTLLITPIDAKVKIYTDSAAAIEMVKKGDIIKTNKEWLKQKNYNLLLKIIETKQSKNLDLELIKVKGHSENKWNNEADRLAKIGLNAPELYIQNIDKNSRLRYNMFWNKSLIEMPTRKFIKDLEETKIAAEWKVSSIASLLETSEKLQKWDWKNLWKRIKEQSGVKCTSIRKGKKLNFLIKCLHNKLPTLDNLTKRRPDLYKDNSYKVCKKNTEETQAHLACCKAQEVQWLEIEQVATETVQTLIEEAKRKEKSCTENLRKCIFGEDQKEREERREGFIKGLYKVIVAEDLQVMGLSKKEADQTLDTVVYIVWNCFHEVIWRWRCEKVIEWEQEEGIVKEQKIKKKLSMRKEKKNNKRKIQEERSLDPSSIAAEKSKSQRVKEKKVEKNKEIDKLVEKMMVDRVFKGGKPFWYGT